MSKESVVGNKPKEESKNAMSAALSVRRRKLGEKQSLPVKPKEPTKK